MDRRSLVVAACLIAAPAYGAHPLITEDTGTQGTGKQQLEVNVNRFDFSESRWQTQWGATWSIGVSDSADLQVGMPYFAALGKGDLSVDLKWRYWQSGDFSLGTKPGFTLPTGDETERIGAGELRRGFELGKGEQLLDEDALFPDPPLDLFDPFLPLALRGGIVPLLRFDE